MAAKIRCLKKLGPAYFLAPAEACTITGLLVLISPFHDGAHLFEVIHIKRREPAVVIFCGMV